MCTGPEALANKDLAMFDHSLKANISLAYFKKGDFSMCLEYCNKALLRRKSMPAQLLEKTLFRKANCELELGNCELAISTCTDLLSDFPNNVAAQQVLLRAKHGLKEANEARRKTFSNIFNSSTVR